MQVRLDDDTCVRFPLVVYANGHSKREAYAWIEVADHLDSRMSSYLVQVSITLASEIDFYGVEVHPTGTRIRLAEGAHVSPQMLRALTEFGDHSRAPDHLDAAPKRVTVTLWDQLVKEDG